MRQWPWQPTCGWVRVERKQPSRPIGNLLLRPPSSDGGAGLEAAQFMCVRATQIAKAESRLSSVMHAAPLDYRQRPKIASLKGAAVINTISRRYATMICWQGLHRGCDGPCDKGDSQSQKVPGGARIGLPLEADSRKTANYEAQNDWISIDQRVIVFNFHQGCTFQWTVNITIHPWRSRTNPRG